MTQTMSDELPLPPVARLLGPKLVVLDPQPGTMEAELLARAEFTNPSGFFRRGMIAAILDDTLGPAIFAMSGGRRMSMTIDLHLYHVRPLRPGRVTTTAKVIHLGSRDAFVESRRPALGIIHL